MNWSTGTIIEHDSAYKRGLVLGLTMAEIVLLVLFIVLLLLASVLREKEVELEGAELEIEQLAAQLTLLRDNYVRIAAEVGGADDLDDLFTELELARRENEVLKDIVRALEEAGIPANDPTERRAFVDALRQAVAAFPGAGGDATKTLAQIPQAVADLKGQIKNLQTRLGGKGTEKPACWTDEFTGRPEYIFDIALGAEGLIIRDRKLPHRASAQAGLPLEAIAFEQILRPDEFLDQTRPLFNWTEANNCRFFVRAYDLTPPDQKLTYKERMRTLEVHFYKWEDLQGAF